MSAVLYLALLEALVSLFFVNRISSLQTPLKDALQE